MSTPTRDEVAARAAALGRLSLAHWPSDQIKETLNYLAPEDHRIYRMNLPRIVADMGRARLVTIESVLLADDGGVLETNSILDHSVLPLNPKFAAGWRVRVTEAGVAFVGDPAAAEAWWHRERKRRAAARLGMP